MMQVMSLFVGDGGAIIGRVDAAVIVTSAPDKAIFRANLMAMAPDSPSLSDSR